MYRLQSRFQDTDWQDLDGEEFDSVYDAMQRAALLSRDAICYGVVRVLHWQEIVVEFSAGGHNLTRFKAHLKHAERAVSQWPAWKQKAVGRQPIKHHISPNGAEPGSYVHDAEKWFLSKGMEIPKEHSFPHSYQGMLDDFGDRGSG